MTREEAQVQTQKVQDILVKQQSRTIRELTDTIKKLKDENEMLAAITKYIMKYRLNDNETNISFADIEKMVEIKSDVKVFENIGGEYFLRISLPTKE